MVTTGTQTSVELEWFPARRHVWWDRRVRWIWYPIWLRRRKCWSRSFMEGMQVWQPVDFYDYMGWYCAILPKSTQYILGIIMDCHNPLWASQGTTTSILGVWNIRTSQGKLPMISFRNSKGIYMPIRSWCIMVKINRAPKEGMAWYGLRKVT